MEKILTTTTKREVANPTTDLCTRDFEAVVGRIKDGVVYEAVLILQAVDKTP